MNWSYVLFLPAAVSAACGLATIVIKHRPTTSQVLLALMQLMLAAAIAMLAIYFRGHSGVMFIYSYLFEVMAVMIAPMLYIGLCSLTEPRGVSRRQRQTLLPSLLFVALLTLGALAIGWRDYDALCRSVAASEPAWREGDPAFNFMLFWSHWMFPAVLVVYGGTLLIVGSRKVWVYQQRFNSYYAEGLNVKNIDCRPLAVMAWLFLPVGVLSVYAVDFRPHYYKYWLIVFSLLLTVLQFFIGRFVYRQDYDAAYLARYIRERGGLREENQ